MKFTRSSAPDPLAKSSYVLPRVSFRADYSQVAPSQHATWHVPPGQEAVAQSGAAANNTLKAPPSGTSTPSRPGLTRTSTSASGTTNKSLLSINTNKSAQSTGIKVDVALKVIPKKKVKGNEDSVWGEMEVLKGLDHPNIVCSIPRHLTITYN